MSTLSASLKKWEKAFDLHGAFAELLDQFPTRLITTRNWPTGARK